MAKKILVIDDDPDILDATKLILEDAGYGVEITAKDGDQIEKFLKNPPDVIILDVLLSGSDGREICKRLKQQSKTKHIPIIMISAHPDAEKSALESGADEFVAKPFDMNDLLKKVEKYAG